MIDELGLPVELIDVDLMAKTKAPELLAASPGGKVPALVDDDGFTLFESRAINAYLASKRPERGLYPDDPKRRALVDQWSYWQAIHLGPAMQAIAYERVLKTVFKIGTPDEAAAVAKQGEVDRLLPVLERGLEGMRWLAGDSVTLADFAVASTFYLRGPARIAIAGPNVERWIERVEALPSWQRALPRYVATLGR